MTSPQAANGLTIENISAGYGQALAIRDISLTVAPGQVVALLGRNGAGKSTTLKAVMGMLHLRSGSVSMDGVTVSNRPVHARARTGIGYVPEDRRIFTGLTVSENLEAGRRPADGTDAWTPKKLFDLFPNLAPARDRHAAQLSGGEQQMLALARTLMGNPRMLLLDEPSEGLAPVIVDALAQVVKTLKQEGLGILLCEQNTVFTAKVADRAAIIESGSLQYEGSMSELALDDAVRKRYLAV
ncbi:ABC transporter ATP-binding protein [Hwanghaeella grinnelliae]|uniref:ABC transporter ATP-binding protein n=1 Tax=Hwanghaeella grinnelliae TaxID=2500179 RepID=A0A3S2VP45_9PROT|nr:ABC transporter ATP-binding protein [Hwanghaeella grinnelliae]RVU38297.1 ABC transporter ATP-binding protein [Hwanghaeella grinnelliae]